MGSILIPRETRTENETGTGSSLHGGFPFFMSIGATNLARRKERKGKYNDFARFACFADQN
jgi:hypothetical protein